MQIVSLSTVLNAAFNYVIQTSSKYNIDESHSLKHSMEVFHFANNIYDSELVNHPYLKQQKEIISVSSIIHDMCDKKYMDESTGINNMNKFMKDYMSSQDLGVVSQIVSSMSYSTVKLKGYPNLGKYQMAYHIVREADLLAAYDIDRCIIYGMRKENVDYITATKRALELFDTRVLKYRDSNLFITNYAKHKSLLLHNECLTNLEIVKTMMYKEDDTTYF